MTYLLPSEYYGWAKNYLETTANTIDDITDMLIEDEEFTEDVARENKIDEADEAQLDEALKELAPLMARQLIKNFEESQKTWSTETDNIRLTRALKSLEPSIISFEGMFCCSSCGFYEIRDDHKNNKTPQATGFVFYMSKQSNEHMKVVAYTSLTVHLTERQIKTT